MSLFASKILIGFVALEHFAFLVLEMFLWKTPLGQRIFGTTAAQAIDAAPLAANQGLYNGFLAAGLIWALITGRSSIAIFFLSCVIVAGVFGAATAKGSILFVQALPAAIALALVFASR